MSKELRFPRVNYLVLSGRLTRDPELRFTTTGKAFTKLSLAFDRSYKKNGEWVQEASFVDVTVWEKTAEKCASELTKGSPVMVEGSLRVYNYQDKNNQNRKGVELLSNKIHFLTKTDRYNDKEDDQPQSQAPSSFDDVPF